ncbi:unnamed protein product [Mucor hiemalis]
MIPENQVLFNSRLTPASRKRKRDEGTTEQEGPAAKRQEASLSQAVETQDIGSENSGQSISSASTLKRTRSTAATITSRVRDVLSSSKKAAEKTARTLTLERKERQKKIQNPAFTAAICSYCFKNNTYDPQNPHSSRRSRLFPGHIQSTEDYIIENVGQDYRRFVVKTGLENVVNLRQHKKLVFLRIVSELVNNYRLIAIKSQLFASYYIRFCLSNNVDLSPIIFNQAFFYACIQKVLGKDITNTNVNLPRDHMNAVFQD